ncbi:MAG: hypothetical protein ABL868_00260 [Sulfuriferula sp.]
MKLEKLLLRYFAEKKDGQWQLFCLDLCLAAQADTFEEGKAKLDAMVDEYIYDALVGEDRQFAAQLLNRKAPFIQWMKYYWYSLIINTVHITNGMHKIFKEPIPLSPARRCHA